MTSIDSTVIPEHLAEEYLDTVIENNETYVSKLSEPLLVFVTSSYASSTAIVSCSISGRTLTFTVTGADAQDFGTPVGCHILVKGRL